MDNKDENKLPSGSKQNITKMTREERREFVRNQTNKICDRNDAALRRISKE